VYHEGVTDLVTREGIFWWRNRVDTGIIPVKKAKKWPKMAIFLRILIVN